MIFVPLNISIPLSPPTLVFFAPSEPGSPQQVFVIVGLAAELVSRGPVADLGVDQSTVVGSHIPHSFDSSLDFGLDSKAFDSLIQSGDAANSADCLLDVFHRLVSGFGLRPHQCVADVF